MSLAEEKLLREYARSRDAEAFAELVARHRDMVFGICYRIVGNREDAEDVAQQCFIQMALKSDELHTPLAPWLHRVATHCARNLVRKNSAHKRREKEAAVIKQMQQAERGWDEMKAAVDEAIDSLPKHLREAVILHFMEGMSQQDVALQLGITQEAVSTRLGKAVERLRKRLRKAGIIASVAALLGLFAREAAAQAPASLVRALGKMAILGPSRDSGPWAPAPRFWKAPTLVKALALTTLLAAVAIAIWKLPQWRTTNEQHGGSAPVTSVTADTGKLATNISGRVVDGRSQPIAGASVIVWHDPEALSDWPTGRQTERILAQTTTGPDGRFELLLELPEHQALAPTLITFIAESFGTHDQPLADGALLPPELRMPDVRLGPGIELSGRLLDTSGKPVPGLLVSFSPNRSPYLPDSFWAGRSILHAETDAQGCFLIPGVNPSLPLIAHVRTKDGQVLLSRWGIDPDKNNDLILPDFGVIEGQVLDFDGNPLPDALLRATPSENLRLGEDIYGRADWQGRFRFVNVVPAVYRFEARAGQAYGSTDTVIVRPGETVRCQIRTVAAFDLFGEVVFRESRRLTPNIPLFAVSREHSFFAPTRSDEARQFVFRGLPAGYHEVSVGTPADETPWSVTVGPTDPAPYLRIELSGPGLDTVFTGIVRDQTGRPAGGALVGVPRMPGLWTIADHEGRFQVRALSANSHMGRPVLVVARSADATSWGYGEIVAHSAGEPDASIVLNRPLRTVSGCVADESGNPVAGAVVSARALSGAPLSAAFLGASTLSADDGSFLLTGVDPESSYRIDAAAPGYVSVAEQIGGTPANLDTRVVLKLTRAQEALRGTVFDHTGVPLSGVILRCFAHNRMSTAVSNADGAFKVSGLRQGETVELSVHSVLYEPQRVQVVVSSHPVNIFLERRTGED